jgi:tetratricopeptide (TPR) repeat protein
MMAAQGSTGGKGVSELHPISDRCNDPQRTADVVFIHGLGGDHVLTWRHGDKVDDFWPAWLTEEFSEVGVWTLSYAASPSAWFRLLKKLPLRWAPGLKGFYQHADRDTGHSMHLPDRGVEVLNGLVLQGLGNRPLIFVCHSLGGLLAKQILRTAYDDGRASWKAVRDSTVAAMYLSTPHDGSRLATVINRIGKGLRINPSLYGLKANDPHLRDLGRWYVNNSSHIENVVYFETRDTFGLRVVDEGSAQLGVGHTPVPQDEDHLSISKPRRRDADVCKDLRRLVEKAIRQGITRDLVGPEKAGDRASEQTIPVTPVAVHVHVPQPHVHVQHSPAGDTPATPCQLPQAASRFFGRAEALQTLTERLRSGAKQTVIVGPAGFGKTALVAEALRLVLGEPPEQGVTRTHFPHGIVFVDLYLYQGQAERAWGHIADSVRGANFNPQWDAHQRAAEACRGRSLLLIVEGGEEADGSGEGASRRTTRHELIQPLRWEGRIVWLTRPMPQSPAEPDIELETPLEQQDAVDLFDHLTRRARAPIPNLQREALLALLEWHPLAITWACGQVVGKTGGQLDALIEDLRRQPTRRLKDREQHQHTLQWLFQRSLRGASADMRRSLAAAGLLAHKPLPLAAFQAATGLGADAQRAALSEAKERALLVHSGQSDSDEAWGFSHVLGYHFSRAMSDGKGQGDAEVLDAEATARLATWVHTQLAVELAQAQPAEALAHAEQLLQCVDSPMLWWPLCNGLIYEHQDRLLDLGRLNVCDGVLQAVERFWQQLPGELKEASEYLNQYWALVSRQGDLLEAQGDLAAAQQRYETSLRISDAPAQRDPDNAEWQRDLSVSHNRLGDLLQAQGDLAAAQQRYETGLKIAETLAQRDPDNAGWQRDLSVSHNKLGDLLQAQGDLAAAQQRYEASLRIRDALAQRDPDNAGWQRDLSVSFERLGDLLQAQGDLAAAQQRYEASLRIRDALAKRDPDNAGWQRDLSISFERLGNLLQAQGDLAAAQQRYEASLRIRDALAKRDPDNAGWQRDWAVSWIRLGMVHAQQGDQASMRHHWQHALEIYQALVTRLPHHPQFVREYTMVQQILASIGQEA